MSPHRGSNTLFHPFLDLFTLLAGILPQIAHFFPTALFWVLNFFPWISSPFETWLAPECIVT